MQAKLERSAPERETRGADGRQACRSGAPTDRHSPFVRGDTLEGAIVGTVAYCDVFAFAPRAEEIHRFLMGFEASREAVDRALTQSPDLRAILGTRDGCFFLRGKDHLAPRRIRFSRHSAGLWPQARALASVVERTGLASCGVVTGSLAADNADEHADIDFLFIYPGERTFTSFAGVRLVQKLPIRGMKNLCPNYALAEDRLEVRPQNLFTAWEIAKCVPMFGADVFRAFVEANRWIARYLPNASQRLDALCDAMPEEAPRKRRLAPLLSQPWFQRIEAAERRRKQKNDTRDVGVDVETRAKRGSMDRHSPTRSFHALSELRYRMGELGLETHPLYDEIAEATGYLGDEMHRWGATPLRVSAG